MNFEEKMQKLEQISKAMREDDQGLDKAILSFEEGVKLAKELEKELESYEKRVEILVSDNNGDHLEDFE